MLAGEPSLFGRLLLLQQPQLLHLLMVIFTDVKVLNIDVVGRLGQRFVLGTLFL